MPRVLVVEDYLPLRRAQVRTLQRAAWYVTLATSTQEAMRKLEWNVFDVLILDMDITAGESRDLLHRVCTGTYPIPTVLLLCPTASDRHQLAALDTCIVRYKPVGRDALLSGVTTALETTHRRP